MLRRLFAGLLVLPLLALSAGCGKDKDSDGPKIQDKERKDLKPQEPGKPGAPSKKSSVE
jgi:hypothetical protein